MPVSPKARIIVPFATIRTTPINIAATIRPTPRRVIAARLRMPVWMKREPPVYGYIRSVFAGSVPMASSPTSFSTLLPAWTHSVAMSARKNTPHAKLPAAAKPQADPASTGNTEAG